MDFWNFYVLLEYGVVEHIQDIWWVKTMLVPCLIPLTLFLVSAVITTGTDRRTLDGIPAPIAAIIGMGCLIWFVAVCPWEFDLLLVVAVLVVGKAYLEDILKLDWIVRISDLKLQDRDRWVLYYYLLSIKNLYGTGRRACSTVNTADAY